MDAEFLIHTTLSPTDHLQEFIERFWVVKNISSENREIIIVPDGRVDLIFSKTINAPFFLF